MPAKVDRERTRARIIELAMTIVADEGLSALTIRRVGEAAGTSRALVGSYFGSMDELMSATFAVTANRQGARIDAAVAEHRGLEACVAALLPLDAETLRDWRVLIAFHGIAVAVPEFMLEEQARIDGACRRFERILMAEFGITRINGQVRDEARRIVNNIKGTAYDLSFHPKPDRSASEKRKIVRQVLQGLPSGPEFTRRAGTA